MGKLWIKSVLILIAQFTLLCNYPTLVSSWSTSTILDLVANLFQPTDPNLQYPNDPLLESIKEHEHNHDVNEPIKVDNVRYLVPMLSNVVGDNNQLMEYMGAALVARATHRTLCLTPFFNGPPRHSMQLPKGGLTMEERYDMELLSKFVETSSLEVCLQACKKDIDGVWWLHKSYSSLTTDWKWGSETTKIHDLAWSYVNWTSIDHIKQALNVYDDEKCVAMGGLFPGFRWRGAYLAPSLFIHPSKSISMDATTLQNIMVGANQDFIAVHWRFEESLCKDHQLGLCFLRCGDGSVIDSGLHPVIKNLNMTYAFLQKENCPRDGARGVVVSKVDLIEAIYVKSIKENVSTIYLATDGWMRGPTQRALVKEVVEEMKRRGLKVVGLWRNIMGLPNLMDGRSYEQEPEIAELVKRRSGHAISEVEQELCRRAKAFMGSGQSTWSLVVFRTRIVDRIRQQQTNGTHPAQDDEALINTLLADSHAAGLQCRYNGFFRRASRSVKAAQERYEDEAPDTWLDVEACEVRLSLPNSNGSCKFTACSL